MASKNLKKRVKAAPVDLDNEMTPADASEPVMDVEAEHEEHNKAEDEMVEEDEKYSAQVLRRLHQDALILLEEYDEMRGPLEHEEIDGHLAKKLESLVDDIEEIENLWSEHHSDAKPLEGREDTKELDDASEEEEIPEEEEGGDNDEGTDEAIPADSDDDNEPTPDEAVEGMEKEKENKGLRTRRKSFEPGTRVVIDQDGPYNSTGQTGVIVRIDKSGNQAEVRIDKGGTVIIPISNLSLKKNLKQFKKKGVYKTIIYVSPNNPDKGKTEDGRPCSFSQSLWDWTYDDVPKDDTHAIEHVENPQVIRKNLKKGVCPECGKEDCNCKQEKDIKAKKEEYDEPFSWGMFVDGFEEDSYELEEDAREAAHKRQQDFDNHGLSSKVTVRRIKNKALKKEKGICPTCGKDHPEEEWGLDGKPHVNQNDQTEQKSFSKGLESHEKPRVAEAAGFLNELSSEQNFGDEHRMKSYHYHKDLGALAGSAIGTAVGGPAGGAVGGAIGGAVDSAMSSDSKARDSEGHGWSNPKQQRAAAARMREDDDFDESPKSLKKKKDFDPLDQQDQNEDVHPHRKMCGGVSKFFKALSTERAFGDPHRSQAAEHFKALDGITKEDMVEELQQEDDEDKEVMPGEMGEKAVVVIGNYAVCSGNEIGKDASKWFIIKHPSGFYVDGPYPSKQDAIDGLKKKSLDGSQTEKSIKNLKSIFQKQNQDLLELSRKLATIKV